MTTLIVDIWSDIACPWCYVGKRRLESALGGFEHRDDVVVRWRSFELRPDAPPVESSDLPYVERLASKYRTTKDHAQAMIDRMTSVAATVGLDFSFERMQTCNTFDAHRLLHLALEQGCQDALKERLLCACLCDGEPLGDRKVLERLGVEVGLPEGRVRSLLASDQFVDAVREEETEARLMGISGVPFFVFGRRYAVSGAQQVEVLTSALEKAWGEAIARSTIDSYPEGAVCGPDGCG